MKPIDWLLAHLDEPGVLEVVLGIGRPVAARSAEGFRPITSMNFERSDIETLVAGTPMSGLIGSPMSLPPTEMQVDARRLIVEVVRQGFNAALRIALVGAQAGAAPPERSSSTTVVPRTTTSPRTTSPPQAAVDDGPIVSVRMTRNTVQPRTVTPTAPPETLPPDEPIVSVRMTRNTVQPRTVTPTAPPETLPPDEPIVSVRMTRNTVQPRTVTPTAPPETLPPDEPIVSVRMTRNTVQPRTVTPTTPPRAVAPSSPPATVPYDEVPDVAARMASATLPPRSATTTMSPRTVAATTPPMTVTPISTTTMPRVAPEPPYQEPYQHETAYQEPAPEYQASSFPDYDAPGAVDPALPDESLQYANALGGGGEIEDAEAHQEYGTPDYGGQPSEQPASDWYGPQIIDERTDITAVHALLDAAYRRVASDLHVIAKQPVTIRRLGELARLDVKALAQQSDRSVYSALMGPLDPSLAERFLLPLLGPSARQRLAEVGYVDFGFEVPGRGRARANISQQQDGLAGSFRLCRDKIPTLEGLGLPRELEKTVRHHQGLVVIAGPSGHGKTTTMAALVDLLNTSNTDHIITIEDPVEIEHPAKKAIVSHREVGRHTLSFVSALKASLREDPDVIVIGELRDRETVEIALAAAETGHLVLSTISTPSAVKTIDRLIDMFPPDDQVQVRASISGTLRAVIAQRLLPNATQDGMVAAIELVTGVLPLATMIRDNKLFQLPSLMQRGRAFGMLRLDDSLVELVRARRITEEVALNAAQSRKDLAALLSGRPTPTPTNVRGLFGGKGPA